MDGIQFQVGDLVTRDGTDVQRVVAVDGFDDITVICVKAPASGWCRVGDAETNLAGRYLFAGGLIDGSLPRAAPVRP